MMRGISDEERDAILRLADKLDEKVRNRIAADLEHIQVEDAVQDRARLIFHIAGYTRPPYRGQRSYPVEGEMRDADGVPIEVILYADENGRLLELEFMRRDEGNVVNPDWSTLNVY
jgi:hypothetical protein